MIWEDVKAELIALLRVLFGFAIATSSGLFLWLEYHPSPAHTSHIAIFSSGIILGLAIMWPSVVIGTATQLLALVPVDWIPPVLQRKIPPPGGPTT